MKNIVLSFLLLAVLPTAASAGDVDYTYVQAGLAQNHLTGVDGGSGATVNGSLGLPLGFFLDGSVESARFDLPGSTSTMRRTTAHAGWHVGVMDSLDLVFRLGGTNAASDAYSGSATGYDANVGLRVELPAGFEMEVDWGGDHAAFVYTPSVFPPYSYVGPDKTTETYGSAALRYHVTDHVLVGLSYRTATSHPIGFDSTLRTWLLSARWNF